ncbi:MAG: PDZ domain-containing protein [Candidatus Omnitrophica bacterium]|nr:PDZ domain-containing protein [Candidatus Omnitrophota bacterium]
MPLNIKKTLQENRFRSMKTFPFIEVGLSLLVVIALLALFIDNKNANRGQMTSSRLAMTGASSAIEFNVVNVNPIIAKDFGLASVAGVLVNDVPKGSAMRLIDIRRGDVILKYNAVDVQSANHLTYLMSQTKQGDTISFVINRNGKTLTLVNKVPVNAGVDIFGPRGRDIMVVLVIIAITFTMLFLNLFNRTVCVTLGAVLMLAAGSVFGFYKQSEAFDSISMSPIFIFMGMSIFAIFLEDLRFFEYVARRTILFLKFDQIKLILSLFGITFVASAFMNNISIILVMVPITIYSAKGLGFDPIPVVIAEVISSTLGGNATPIGDFSNMLMATRAGLTFVEFIMFMGPICLICFAVFMWYMWFFEFRKQKRSKSDKLEKVFLKKVGAEVDSMNMDWVSIKRVLIILGSVLVAFLVLPGFKVHLAPIAMGGGFILLAIENHKAKEVIKKISLTDVIFFIALFLIVGGALYSGLLKVISNCLLAASMGNQLVYLLLLMWTTAVFTSFLNSGPASAFFIPIVMHSGYADFSDVVWWAMSIGTMAGGSACITGASAGIISQTLVDELHTSHLADKGAKGITFGNYCMRGVPVAVIFLTIASFYIWFLTMLP